MKPRLVQKGKYLEFRASHQHCSQASLRPKTSLQSRLLAVILASSDSQKYQYLDKNFPKSMNCLCFTKIPLDLKN